MNKFLKLKLMFYFTLIYLVVFTILAILKGNYEFLYYTFVMTGLIFTTLKVYRKFHLSYGIMVGLTILGVLHIFGGNLYVFGTRLYDLWLIPQIFKYDNLVHLFGIFVATLVSYNLLIPHISRKIEKKWFLLSGLLILIALGIGAINELVELAAVVFFGAAAGVGDYMNNAIDIVFNLIGSVIACVFIWIHYEKKKIREYLKGSVKITH